MKQDFYAKDEKKTHPESRSDLKTNKKVIRNYSTQFDLCLFFLEIFCYDNK